MGVCRVLLALVLFSSSFLFADCTPEKALLIIKNISRQWRSSDYFIPGGILRDEIEKKVQPKTLIRELVRCEESVVVVALKMGIRDPEVLVDHGVARNILKIRKIFELGMHAENPFKGPCVEGVQDEVCGMGEKELAERLGNDFPTPAANKFTSQSFNLKSYLLRQLSRKSVIDNDTYAFSTAAILWAEGFHKNKEAVFINSSRGVDRFPFLVAGGQDQIIDMLENLHFDRWEIEALKVKLSRSLHVPEGFWEWLKSWRFKGKIVGVPVGTLIFPNTPVLQIITDPVSALIVESLINPWMSSMTTLMTRATRLDMARGGIPKLTEAGTRRVVTGNLSAYSGVMAGADGTSNFLMAELLGVNSYGTMQHAFVMMNGGDANGFDTFLSYAAKPTMVLPDTYDLEAGVAAAFRAGGPMAIQVRQDSNIITRDGKELSTEETASVIQSIWRRLGRGDVGAIVTNDLDEKSLWRLAQSGLKIDAASLGGAYASPSDGVGHGNFVYKLAQLRDLRTGEITYPIKIANKHKATQPAYQKIWRVYAPDTAKALYDLVTEESEQVPDPNAYSLQTVLMENGKRVEPRADVNRTLIRIRREVGRMPEAITSLTTTSSHLRQMGDNYPVRTSALLQKIKADAIERDTPKRANQILVFFGSFDPFTRDGHLEMIKRANAAYLTRENPLGFTKVILVPANDKPVHGRSYSLHGQARIEQIRNQVAGLRNSDPLYANYEIEVWDREVNETGDHFTIDTLAQIQRQNSNANLVLLSGEDSFYSIGDDAHPWKGATDLVRGYDHLVFERPDSPSGKAKEDTLARVSDYKRRLRSLESPASSRTIQFIEPIKGHVSATKVRAFYDALPYTGFLHITDPQQTFRGDYGRLGSPGTLPSIPFMVGTLHASLIDTRIKVTFSGDEHFPIQLTDPTYGPEFHPPASFPAHGMKGVVGPEGDEFIPELIPLLSSRPNVVIPSHQQVGDKLELVPFDLEDLGKDIFDPRKIIRFEKSTDYSVFSNPRYGQYLEKVDPHRVLPHFEAGWCTDYCVYASAKGKLERGYNVYLIIDAIAGVFPASTKDKLVELMRMGAKVMTTQEYTSLVRVWDGMNATWSDVLNTLSYWRENSKTEANLKVYLEKETPCSTFLSLEVLSARVE